MKAALILAVLATPAVVLADLEAVVWTASWFFVWLGFPLAGVVLLVVGRARRSSRTTSAALALVLAGIAGGIVARQVNVAKVQGSKDLGDRICVALEAHKAAAGAYPQSLDELVPGHLDRIPVSRTGVFTRVPYFYQRFREGRAFVLGFFGVNGLAVTREDGVDAEWQAVPLPASW